MPTAFTILFLLSLVLLVWGVVAPRHFTKLARNGTFTRKTAGLGFGLPVFACFVLIGITAPKQPNAPPSVNLTATSAPAPSIPKTLGDSTTTQQVTETMPVAYHTTTQADPSLPKGQAKVIQAGKDGIETRTYEVTYTNGQQTDKTLVSDVITTEPTREIIASGTYVAPTPAPAPAPTPTPTPACYPLTNGGNCYEPGEYCRNSDHGASGVAGDGEPITCEDNYGWRWEPVN